MVERSVTSTADLLFALEKLFVPEPFPGIAAEHECLECEAIRSTFARKAWTELSHFHLTEHDGALPLLTPDAYQAFFPAWIRAALEDPEGSIATMALIDMEATDLQSVFSPEQRRFLVECAMKIHGGDTFAIQDAECIKRIQNICTRWAV